MKNREFAKQDIIFNKCCELATADLVDRGKKGEILPTKRQASKFRRGIGSAYKHLSEVTKPEKDNEQDNSN